MRSIFLALSLFVSLTAQAADKSDYIGSYEVVNATSNRFESDLRFTIDEAFNLEFKERIEAWDTQAKVTFTRVNSEEGFEELGYLMKITLYWLDDGSPCQYTLVFYRQGGMFDLDMKLLYAFSIENDGEVFLGQDKHVSLESFEEL